MKRFYKTLAVVLIVIICAHAKVQSQSTHAVTVCSIVLQENNADMMSNNAPLILYMQDSITNKKIAIVFSQSFLKKMTFDPRKKLVNQQACITGVVKKFNMQPAIFISNEKQIKLSEKASVNKMSSNSQ